MTIIAGLSLGFLFNGLSTVFPLLAFIFAFFGKNSISKVAFVLGLISGIIGLLWFVFGIVTFIAAIGVGNNPANAIAFLMFGFGHLTSIITLALIKWSKI
ncbi:MAG: hypothetical protein E7545_02240 [Ruminococcaceae bacterium]|nr:hypothetical protein [Oscillospiraceae bacterium]